MTPCHQRIPNQCDDVPRLHHVGAECVVLLLLLCGMKVQPYVKGDERTIRIVYGFLSLAIRMGINDVHQSEYVLGDQVVQEAKYVFVVHGSGAFR